MNDFSRRTLPSTAMLHCFTAAARFGSFSRAGDEIGLTQGAISRQIAGLEEQIGCLLFSRVGRRVELNERGQRFYEDVMPALVQIRRATSRAVMDLPEKVVELATLPSFGMRWLAPKLPRLTERHPDLVVNIAARSDVFDFALESYDAAIHVGKADWPDADHDFLFRERVIPVVSPSLLAQHPINGPEDLLDLPLLVQSARQDAWSRWFNRAGVDGTVARPISHIAHWLMLAQAVAAGAGAALIPTFVIEPELRSGSLIAPLDLPLEEDRAYYLVYPAQNRERPAIAALREWMLSEIAFPHQDR